MNKLLIFNIVFLLCISSTYALNITSPLNNSVINSSVDISWTESGLPIENFKVYMNSTNIYNLSGVSASQTCTYNGAGSGSCEYYGGDMAYHSSNYTDLNTTIFNFTWEVWSIQTGVTVSSYIIVGYIDNSTLTTGVCTFAGVGTFATHDCGTFSNPQININVSYITYYYRKSTFSTYHVGVKAGYYSPNYATTGSFNFNPYNYFSQVGDYNLNISAFNYTGQLIDSQVINVSMITNSLLNITALNYTGGIVYNFTVNITDLSTNTSTSLSTSTGLIYYDGIIGRNYTIQSSSPLLANIEYNITILTNTYNLTISTFPYNSVLVYSFLELDNSALNVNASLLFKGQSSTFTRLLNGSSDVYSLFPDDIYTITVTSSGYATRTYVITIVNASTQILNIYMLDINSSSIIGIYTKSLEDNILSGANVQIQQLVNTSYLGVTQGLTDGTGLITFKLQEGKTYRVLISADNFNVYQTDLVPYLTNSPYTFKLASSSNFVFTTLNDYVKYSYSPTTTSINASNQTFSFTTYSVNGSILYTYINCGGLSQNVSGSPSGVTVSINLTVTPSSVINCMFAFDVVETGFYSFNVTYRGFREIDTSIKASAKIVKDATSQVWLTLLSFIIIIGVALGIKKKFPDTRITGIILCVGIIVFVAIGWIDYVAGGVSATIGLLLLYVGSR